MNRKFFYVLCLLIIGGIQVLSAQKITNELQGYFKASSDTAMYEYFTFDGNGRVDIMGIGNGYYFQKDDSLIVYPDKSIFKFVIKGDKLYGASDWVDGCVWEKVKDTTVETLRTDPVASDRIAGLLYQYYSIKRRSSELSLLFEGPDSTYASTLKNLCDSGLSKACLDYAGLKTLEDMGGIAALYSSEKQIKKRAPNQEILDIIYRAIDLGDTNGYEVLGGYYAAIGDIQAARESLEAGQEVGCGKCAMALFSMELEAEAMKLEKKNKTAPAKKSAAKTK
ncbi:hypothetical protein U0035_04235 [Niabella yanshanensis]|uniref:Sel1 repeat family protein n=1 Tax=Niabella yanshanensis TaxID=577386 RepID=A0ABZ0WB96_9BACT|nr:hypothetical protein [Niabella yanshanensis]WQD39356.1 hypothetical protein U0035_04235 [Niabella yanshanensis]